MYNIVKAYHLDDFLEPIDSRKEKGAYFLVSASYGGDIDRFIKKAFQNKDMFVFTTGKLANPDEKQLDFYESTLGMDFKLDEEFFINAFTKWLPRLNNNQHKLLSESIYEVLEKMKQSGRPDNMLKNVYVKFMCWLYYKVERVIVHIGENTFPKIFYYGEVSNHEMLFFNILAESGCDILILVPNEEIYKKSSSGTIHFLYQSNNIMAYPLNFSLEEVQRYVQEAVKKAEKGSQKEQANISQAPIKPSAQRRPNLPANLPVINQNTWLSGDILKDVLKEQKNRGSENFIYNVFARIYGVWDKNNYIKDLYVWKRQLESQGRSVVVYNQLDIPTPKETERVPRNPLKSKDEVYFSLYPLMWRSAVPQLDHIISRAFYDVIMNDSEEKLNRLNNKAIYTLVWFNRFSQELFKSYKNGKYPVFIYFSPTKSPAEAMFLKFLANTIADVVILCPKDNTECELQDNMLFEKRYNDYLNVSSIPDDLDSAVMNTVAYSAEQELTEMLYQDTGLYRHRQYRHASALKLNTMYEEIDILWHEEAPIRPGFEIVENVRVLLPVIAAKINGVKNDNEDMYWESIKKLQGDDTLFIKNMPYQPSSAPQGMKVVDFIKNKKLVREKIKNHPSYKYKILREETQEHILDKVQLMLDKGIIKGTFSQGMEYKILSVVLNLDVNIIRLIQKFDFTKYIPKVVVVACGESSCTLEDAILFAFLHYVGFDVAVYTPTGYQIVESYYTEPLFVDYQIGGYKYNMNIEDMDKLSVSRVISKIFRRD